LEEIWGEVNKQGKLKEQKRKEEGTAAKLESSSLGLRKRENKVQHFSQTPAPTRPR
jgi:hypothetical protein